METAAPSIPRRFCPVERATSTTALPDLRRLITRMVGLALLLLGHAGQAATTVDEPFDYPLGAFADGTATTGAGLAGNWTCGVSGTVVSGLSYAGLSMANNALQSSAARQFATFSTPLASGTKWISFLYQTSPGDPGANRNGVCFPNDQATCLWFGFGLAPYSPTQGELGLGSTTTAGTAAASATSLQLLGLGDYGSTYLVVLKIDFDTSGDNDTVTVYLNPAANQATPGVPAAGTHSAFDVGTLSGVGLNVQGAGQIIVDEIRVGDAYGDVVGFIGTPPDAPTGLGATPGSNSVLLTWTAATGSPTGYNVKRSTTSGSGYTTVGTTTAPTVAYNDSVLGGQTCYYVVSAVNGAGESTNSSQVSATPILAPPPTPTGLAATPGNAQVLLSWTSSSFATSYTVKRSTAPAGPYSPIGGTSDPTATYTDSSGLINGTTYHYVVSATGVGGTSADTAPVSATPVGPMPLVVTLAPGAGIRWFASNNVSYQVQWASELLGTNTVWNDLGNSIIGTGTTNTLFDPVGSPHNAYRVLSIQ
jgi:hypothetical protein